MRIFAFKDEETNQIWAITTKMWSENQEVFNTQMKGAKKQALVTVVYEDGGELNKVIMGDKYIQIAGANALNPKVGAKNWNDCYVVEGDRVFPKDVVEGKKDLTLNEAMEGVFLEGKLEDLVKNKYIKGLPKNVVENIDSEECRKELEDYFQTHISILERKQPSNINFEDNQQLDAISRGCIAEIRQIEKEIGKQDEDLPADKVNEMLQEKQKKVERAKKIAEELASLAEELGKTPQDFLKGE